MKGLIGIAMAVVGGLIGWWGFGKAIAGQNAYNWVWVTAFVVTALGVVTVIARFRHWIDS